METTNIQDWPILPIDLLDARSILGEKFTDREHWMMIVHGSAVPLLIEIEKRYYADEKNSDFTLLTFVGRGEVFAVVAMKKKYMAAYQLISILRQVTDVRLSERELIRRDLVVVAPGELLVSAAIELAHRLFSIADDDLAIAP